MPSDETRTPHAARVPPESSAATDPRFREPMIGPRIMTLEQQRDLILAARHVLRYGKLGKQSRRRLKAAVDAI